MQEKIFDLLIGHEEVSWKTLIFDLVKSEQMDPWDINITLLTQRYIQVIKDMKEHDLRISGKILLAAAILLKMKSAHLIDHDITRLDQLIHQEEEELGEEDLFEELSGERRLREKYKLIPRNPQPRTRKVSMTDLVKALQKAMASKRRILAKQRPVRFNPPKKGVDILEVIRELYHKIVYYNKKDEKKLTFSRLLPPKASKREKIHTFIPLLHLENQQRVETMQKKAFDEIYVKLLGKKS
tara:strand:+ start:1284 stop:2003 length:720 start_codon:yes stop_codon:yes gene_type:complete